MRPADIPAAIWVLVPLCGWLLFSASVREESSMPLTAIETTATQTFTGDPVTNSGTNPARSSLSFDAGELDRILARPLFAATRRPGELAVRPATVPEPVRESVPPVSDPVVEPEPAPSLEYRGIILQNGIRLALVRTSMEGDRILRTGDGIGNWTVLRIEPGTLILANGDRTHAVNFIAE